MRSVKRSKRDFLAPFTSAWEQRKLGEVLQKQIKGKAQSEKLSIGNVEYLDAARLNGENIFLSNGIRDVNADDILIMWDGASAGKVYIGFEGVLGSTLKAYTTKKEVSSKFVYQYLSANEDEIFRKYRTPNIPHVIKNFTDIFNIPVPCLAEQTTIGTIFSTLDTLLTLHQRE
nr:restriction endonuclease subunit S [Streptococcus cuniculi]